MPRHRKVSYQHYEALPEQMALWPDVSGNNINGLGETTIRRPSPIYWHDPDATPHGHLQDWMREYSSKFPVEGRDEIYARRAAVAARKPVPIASDSRRLDPADWASQVRAKASHLGAEIVGITPVDPLWVFEGREVAEPWIIMLGIVMDHGILATAPERSASVEVSRQYARGEEIAADLADWIRAEGFDAHGHCGPMAGPINLVPAALACGFGELGKHGSIINRDYGASFRLACVLTEMPLAADEPDSMDVDDICLNCQLCERDCPAGAITDEKQMVRGVEKWYVDFDKCLPFFNEHSGCALCLAVCPWSTPGRAPRMAEKVERNRRRKASG